MDAVSSLLKRVTEHQAFERGTQSFTPHKLKEGDASIYANHQNYRRS